MSKKRASGEWVPDNTRIYNTATDTITTLPAEIIPDGQPISAVINGNMVQSGAPTPTTPILPSECGDLETEGAKAGQYKIPIPSASTTTNVYLGEVESTRKISKLVLTGEEDWTYITGGKHWTPATMYQKSGLMCICSHYIAVENGGGSSIVANGQVGFYSTTADRLIFCDTNYRTTEDWQTYLQQQYAAGTPVTVWYVLAEETTTTLNEPLRKIGDYSDSVSVSNIPTAVGSQVFDVDTTLKPSEVALSYRGWHKTNPKQRINGEWV